jgi:hypothetical protein
MKPFVEGYSYVHDAFISYSRKSVGFARKLEQTLEKYTPPRALCVAQRRLDVFRDERDFTGGSVYFELIESHLRASSALIVICSLDARRSWLVDDEIQRFCDIRAAQAAKPKIIPLPAFWRTRQRGWSW